MFIYLLDHVYEAPFANVKVESKRWQEFNIGEVWNPVCCHGNEIVELVLWRIKESCISDTNWLRFLSLLNLIKIWLSV